MAKILIVEDEAALLDIYSEILTEAGHQISKALNGREALVLLEKEKYDLVLLDLMMPEVDGLEVLKTVRGESEKFGDVRIVVLTNLSSDIVIKQSFDAKVSGYLMKTELTPQQVVEEVNGFLNE